MIWSTPRQTVAPAALLTLNEIRDQTRMETNDEDPYLINLISVATSYLDGPNGILSKCLLTQTFEIDTPSLETSFKLPIIPVQSYTATYYDANDSQQTLAQIFRIHKSPNGDYLKLIEGQSIPSLSSRDDAVTFTFVCGYGASRQSVPVEIRQAATLLVAHWFEQREPVAFGAQPAEIPFSVDALLANHRRPGW